MGIISRSKNLRRRVKNAFQGLKRTPMHQNHFFRFEFVILITPLSTQKTIFLTGDPVQLICFAVRDLIIIFSLIVGIIRENSRIKMKRISKCSLKKLANINPKLCDHTTIFYHRSCHNVGLYIHCTDCISSDSYKLLSPRLRPLLSRFYD